MLACIRSTLSPTVFVVGKIGHSLCKFSLLAYLRLTIHKYSHMPSSDTVSDRFCRSLDRVFPMETWAASILPINIPQIYSLSIDRHCLWLGLSLARSSILSATLGSLLTSESFFIHMLTCDCPPLSLTVLADGSIGYSLFKFSQLAFLRLTVHSYTHLPLPDTVVVCRWLDRVWSLQLNLNWLIYRRM